jgi:hypothetical protein
MLFKKIIAAYSETHKCTVGKMLKYWFLKYMVHIITTGLFLLA